MADADLLAGVPDDAPMDDDAALAAVEAAEQAALEQDEEERQRAAARARQREAEEEEEMMMEEEEEAAAEAAGRMPKKVGKRKMIFHAIDPSVIAGAIPLTEEEAARRAARAAKFGTAPPEEGAAAVEAAEPPAVVQMLTMEEIAAREARAKKWEIEAPANPLDSVATLSSMTGTALDDISASKAFWERRRDPSAEEEVRPEAVHIFGTDRMSTEDVALYFCNCGLSYEPKWVEWVNDSSANVVFESGDAALEALSVRTVPLLPDSFEIDAANWRTMPAELGAAGKGLQLLFRLATYHDIKPAKRGASRWYGESQRSGGKAERGKRHGRQSSGTPYGRPSRGGGGGGRRGGGGRKTLADAIAEHNRKNDARMASQSLAGVMSASNAAGAHMGDLDNPMAATKSLEQTIAERHALMGDEHFSRGGAPVPRPEVGGQDMQPSQRLMRAALPDLRGKLGKGREGGEAGDEAEGAAGVAVDAAMELTGEQPAEGAKQEAAEAEAAPTADAAADVAATFAY